MKEFILLIYAEGNPILQLPKEKQQQHIQKVGRFIESFAQAGKLKMPSRLSPRALL